MFRSFVALSAFALIASSCGCGNDVVVPCSIDSDCTAPAKCIAGKCQMSNATGGGSGGGGGAAGSGGGSGGGMGVEDGGRFDCIAAPLTCASQGFNCGPAGDGCGNMLDCGSCTMPETCGGGGKSGVCGGRQACTPKTCAQLDAGCGQQSDGCGGLTVNCGSCMMPMICGGAGVPNRCGAIVPDAGVDAGVVCTGLCTQINACAGMPKTTITGTVLAPTDPALFGTPDPLSGAFVYVPNGTVMPFSQGVACEKCSASVSGDPLVYATSSVDGTFTVNNAPCGQNIPLVIQLGRWRRQITIPSVACCANTALTSAQTRFPRTQGEGHPNDNIPLFAVTTGSADNLECILPKIGIAQSEFTTPSGTGRVRMYRDNGVNALGGLPAATTLYNDPAELAKYDVVIADCVGGRQNKTATQRGNMETYANRGGRVFTSHFGYVWLYNQPNSISFTATATWNPDQPSPANQDAFIDVGFPAGVQFGRWVYAVGAQAATSTMAVPKIRVNTVRRDFDAVLPPAERWVWGTPTGQGVTPEMPLQYAFNTPLAAQPADKCGRVLFSDFHVSSGGTYPTCTSGPLTPQEKVFEYLIFDLTSCVTPYVASCTPLTCPQLGLHCGPAGDGCGGLLNCGSCPTPQTCGGGGTPGVCGGGCIPLTCMQLGYNCGPAGDGCGALLDCGVCPSGEKCGNAGPGRCGPGIN